MSGLYHEKHISPSLVIVIGSIHCQTQVKDHTSIEWHAVLGVCFQLIFFIVYLSVCYSVRGMLRVIWGFYINFTHIPTNDCLGERFSNILVFQILKCIRTDQFSRCFRCQVLQYDLLSLKKNGPIPAENGNGVVMFKQ